MSIKIKKVKSVKDKNSIKAVIKKAEKKTGGSSLDIKIKTTSSIRVKKTKASRGEVKTDRQKWKLPTGFQEQEQGGGIQ
tara:strand:+ start:4838 stop:5074 length:237 start_codon:yes stop_codon:yes gene_type:complete